jgi:hypothetical protein
MVTVVGVNKATRQYWVAVNVGMALPIALLIFHKRIAVWLADLVGSFGIHIKLPILSLVLLGVSLGIAFGGIFLMQRLFLLRCPACRAVITPNVAGLVIATKHCPKCGAEIVAPAP